jgi:hypothetical protein
VIIKTPMMTVAATALPMETSGARESALIGPANPYYRLLYGSSATSRARLMAMATWRW